MVSALQTGEPTNTNAKLILCLVARQKCVPPAFLPCIATCEPECMFDILASSGMSSSVSLVSPTSVSLQAFEG
jgi:hypothetical protein